MLPMAAAHDLMYIRHPEQILKNCYTYRPYRPIDEAAVYDICLKTCDDGMDGTEVFPEYPQVICDKLIGATVTLSPEFCFVVEDDHGVMGYAVAAIDAKQLRQRQQLAWRPTMQEKYPKPERTTELTPAEEVIVSLHADVPETPVSVTSAFPSVVRLDVLTGRMEDLAVTKRLLSCALSALRAKGSTGVHVELNVGDKCMLEHYRLLGFAQVKNSELLEETVYLGRYL